MDRCFVFILGKVPVYTVVADIQFAADIPFPQWCVTGVKCGVPLLVPGQQISIFIEAFREIIQAEPVIN